MESGWNVWVWLVGVVSRRYIYIDFLILLIPTPLVSVLFGSSIPTFCSLKNNLFFNIMPELNAAGLQSKLLITTA